MVEYRPLDDDHRDVFFEYTKYAFSPDSGPVAYDPEEHDSERAELGARRGLFADEAAPGDPPLCICAHHWFDALVRGERHPAPGLSAVATPPEHRRAGHVERLLKASLEEYRSRGDTFSLLWPFRYRFYRQFGWETCSAHRVYACEPTALSFARDALSDAGGYRQLDADDYEAIAPVYEEFSSRYALSVDRDEDWWRYRVFESWTTDPYVYAWERDGEVRGYLTYSIEGDWGDRTMRVGDCVFLDHEALLALCAYCSNHDSQVSEVKIRLPADIDLLDLVPAPDDVDCKVETGAMARPVDVAEALSTVQYPAVDARVTLAVADPLVDWNDGAFRLVVADGTATCEPISGTPEPDVTLDVGTLTQLVVGYRSAGELERTNRLTAPAEAVQMLEELYPPEPTFLGTEF